MLLVQLKANLVNQAFISVSYLGEVVSSSEESFEMKNVAHVIEIPQSENGQVNIKTQVGMSSQLSNSPIRIEWSSVLFSRNVALDDELMISYRRAEMIYHRQREEQFKTVLAE